MSSKGYRHLSLVLLVASVAPIAFGVGFRVSCDDLNRSAYRVFGFPVPDAFGRAVVSVTSGPLLLGCMAILLLMATVAHVHGSGRALSLRRAGRCEVCGYDLQGNVSGTCPECGTPTPPPPA